MIDKHKVQILRDETHCVRYEARLRIEDLLEELVKADILPPDEEISVSLLSPSHILFEWTLKFK